MKFKDLNQSEIEKRLHKSLIDASKNTQHYADGLNWYPLAHGTCELIARHTGYTLEVVAGVVAALSPRSKWDRNVKDAIEVLLDRNDEYKFAAYGANVDKAYKIKDGAPVHSVLKGPKVRAFYRLLVEPYNPYVVCLDTWAIKAATGMMDDKVNNVGHKCVELLGNAYRNVARSHRMLPNQLQAVLWVWIREEQDINYFTGLYTKWDALEYIDNPIGF